MRLLLRTCSGWVPAPVCRGSKWIIGVARSSAGCTADSTAGRTAGASAYVSCGSCICLDSLRFRVLLRNRGGLSGPVVDSVNACGEQCSSVDEGWCNNDRVGRYVSDILDGISASSIGCEPTVVVRDVGGGSSVDAGEGFTVGVDRIPVTSNVVSASEMAL